MNKKIIVIALLVFKFSLIAESQRCGSLYNSKKQNFKFKGKFHLDDSSKLKVNGVYLYRYISENDTSKSISRFYRFYKDGKVFISGDFCNYYPLMNDLKDTVYGGMSYYRVKGARIEVEFYGGGYSGYVIDKAVIINSSKIVFLSYRPRGWFTSSVKDPKPDEAIFISTEQ